MKRLLLTAVVVLSLVATASAGQKNRNRNNDQENNNSNSNNGGNFKKYLQNNGGNSKFKFAQKFNQQQDQQSSESSNNQFKKQGKKWQYQRPQLDPGRPDGRVETPNVTPAETQPLSRPGYIFVNGHWERAKPGVVTTGNTTNATVEIRDHRYVEPSGHGSGQYGYGKPFYPTTPSGTTVTNSPPRDLTGQTIYGEGPGLHSVWELIHIDFPELKMATRDHRDVQTPYTESTLPPPPSVRPPGKK
jgi:hypothetical protein